MFKSIKTGSITPILMGLLGGLQGQIAIIRVMKSVKKAVMHLSMHMRAFKFDSLRFS
jgi:hypothetical protein